MRPPHAGWLPRLLVASAVLAGARLALADTPFAPIHVTGVPGTATAVTGWRIQSSAKAQSGGAQIATTDFSTDGWYTASGRATVMAGLLENGKYPDVFYGDNLRAVEEPDASGTMFIVPWWYRTVIAVDDTRPGTHTLLRLNGVIPGADVWLNGELVAPQSLVAGAYPVHELDITNRLHGGMNTLALRVAAADPRTSLSIGWVDWNPTPPDNNMGPWRGVDVLQTGPVQIRYPHVNAALSLPGLERAALTVSAEVRNLDASQAHSTTVTGVAAGVRLEQTIRLAPGETRVVRFSPESTPGLDLRHPRIWWPAGMGDHPLYDLELTASVDGATSDRTNTTFGVRSVTSHLNGDGAVQFVVNGKPVLIRGAGWAPDLFLRANPQRLETEFRYIVNLGLNAIRSEGKLEDSHFYDLADRNGIMVLAGWECCDKWESAAMTGGAPWEPADLEVAVRSMESEARLLRSHPSVIAFLIGSDNAPPAPVSKAYVDALRAADWSLPVIAAAVPQSTPETGPSGMKMEGPYSWVPPVYWYAGRLGGAFGFDSEVSAGASIPRLEDLRRMLSPQELEALWKYPLLRQYHASAAWSTFATLTPFDVALAERYGSPKSLEDFVAKAQLDNYDNARAEFEAFNAHRDAQHPSTGVIYWMLNNAWPSLHWHLYDYFLNPAGAYFGARLANEAVHIQYAYDTHAIMGVNQTLDTERGLEASVRVRNVDGRTVFERRLHHLMLPANGTRELMGLPTLDGLSRTYFIELDLATAGGRPLSRNVYWLSTTEDELDWPRSNWYLTPLAKHADLTALESLQNTPSDVHATATRVGEESLVTVTLSVPAGAAGVAFFQHLTLRNERGGEPVLPVVWSDNDVTLWPGESITVTARFATPTGGMPVVELNSWNAPNRSFPIGVPATPTVAPPAPR